MSVLDDHCTLSIFRLTLVTEFNLSGAEGYADLVRIANTDFIEVQGVTYCGKSKNAELSMKHVPWHEQVIEFCVNLANLLPEYDIACEHEYSNCVLQINEGELGMIEGKLGIIGVNWG